MAVFLPAESVPHELELGDFVSLSVQCREEPETLGDPAPQQPVPPLSSQASEIACPSGM